MNTCVCGRTFMSPETLTDHQLSCPLDKRVRDAKAEGAQVYVMETVPPWMDAKIDQLFARMRRELRGISPAVAFADYEVVMMLLTEPPEGSSKKQKERWELSCDRCGRYCPSPMPFNTGILKREIDGVDVLVAYGACPRCLPLPNAKDEV